MQSSVYIETTVISYLASRPSRDLIVAGHQQITQDWWTSIVPKLDCYVSPYVIQEVGRGDAGRAQERLNAIKTFPVLELNDDVKKVAKIYFEKLSIPEKAEADAFHLALASWHNMDYLVSWNCSHIASAVIIKMVQEINKELEIPTPVICTLEELMEV